MKKLVISMLLVVAMLLTFAACGGTPASEAAPAESTGAPASEAAGSEGGEEAASGEGYKIAYCDTSTSATWRVQALAEIEQEIEVLKEAGVVSEFFYTNANDDPSKQISDINDMITQGVDGIILAAVSPTAVIPAVDAAMDAGIDVVNFNSLIEGDNVTTKISQSDVEFGTIIAEWLVESIGGEGKIIVLNGVAGNSVSNARWSGAEAVFAEYPDIEIVGEAYADWEYGKGKSATESLLSANPEIDGVWSQGGAMTQGAIDAFVAAGRDLVPMTGEAGNGFLRTWIENEDAGFDSIAPNYTTTIGATALDYLIQSLNGETLDAEYVLPLTTITSENLHDSYRADLPDSFWNDTILTEENLMELYGSEE